MKQKICTQCGQCCRNDAPLLHVADMPLVAKGHIGVSQLLTLRCGELAHDPIKGAVLPLEHEAIKIAGTQEKAFPWHCVLHTASGCALHPLRPRQCAALYCTDTSALASMYGEHRATRAHVLDILPKTPMLFGGHGHALMAAHEAECSVRACHALLQKITAERTAEEKLVHKIHFDISFRELCVQKGGALQEELPFLLGRPLLAVIQSFGYTLQRDVHNNYRIYMR